ncbi:MAG: ABC transporter substrate-binding protein [Acidobacteria bacterium]|nr:ABC transporter substrate-binding protein [Acidobacteriota bacterium]NIM63764.1 ABC transporter substrate-binding protein [Acidobacteriota bacterium]NIO59333.1 ABC transporter substrate-binding protein [Acidobacteriota bacterium]NIQ30347.1 ABC transporter substrate-binding protein [Acidobacteriota bacterium]NIQ85284.1 ABC transporter substrate-binding protein [Acidobacteriota bacterium]
MADKGEHRRTTRRRFLHGAAVGAAGATLAGCTGSAPADGSAPAVQGNKRVTWRLASSFPRSLDTLFGCAETLAESLESMSGGMFRVRPYPAGELVPAFNVLDAVQQGTAQVGHSASYYYIGKNPALAFDAGLPFGLTARQQHSWLYEGGGADTLAPVFADFNVRSFPAGSTGVQMGGWFRREVNSLSDLSGLRMRIPGLGGQVMDRLGVNVQQIPGGEIFPALERGAIDATEWVGPYDDERLGFHKIAKHYYYPGWWEPGPTLSFYVNEKAWSSLSVEQQRMFRAASTEASMRMTAQYDAVNPPALKRLLDGGARLAPFPEDVMRAAEKASFELFEEQAAADAGYRNVYEPWKKVREGAYRWSSISEVAYSSFAIRP